MPSTALEGLQTESGWTIGKLVNRTSGTGGNFSVRYTAVSPEGKIGFLKAMDLSGVASKPLAEMSDTIDEYLFEQNILEDCKKNKLTKVVIPLDSGEVTSPLERFPLNRVFYIIFELAQGDLRDEYINKGVNSWSSAFKALHHVAIGIQQLHKIGISHQDIKPSNVLCFPNDESKVSDLGRVTNESGTSPFSSGSFTGDRAYAPIEVIFNVPITEFLDRRLSDLYMFGSLIYHLVSGVQITPVLMEETKLLFPDIFHKSYDEALPFITTSFGTILARFEEDCEQLFGNNIARTLKEMVAELCFPDINYRGNLRYTNKYQRYSLEKYISKMANVLKLAYIEGLQ